MKVASPAVAAALAVTRYSQGLVAALGRVTEVSLVWMLLASPHGETGG